MKISRLAANKIVKNILNRHYIESVSLSFSCSGSEVRLQGWLRKSNGDEFRLNQVEHLISDLIRKLPGYNIKGDLENWHFGNDFLTPLIELEISEIEAEYADEKEES